MKLQNDIPKPFSYFQIVNGDLVDITYRVMQCDQSFSRRLSLNKVIEDTQDVLLDLSIKGFHHFSLFCDSS